MATDSSGFLRKSPFGGPVTTYRKRLFRAQIMLARLLEEQLHLEAAKAERLANKGAEPLRRVGWATGTCSRGSLRRISSGAGRPDRRGAANHSSHAGVDRSRGGGRPGEAFVLHEGVPFERLLLRSVWSRTAMSSGLCYSPRRAHSRSHPCNCGGRRPKSSQVAPVTSARFSTSTAGSTRTYRQASAPRWTCHSQRAEGEDCEI